MSLSHRISRRLAPWAEDPRALPALVGLAFLVRLLPLGLPLSFEGPDSISYRIPAEGLLAGHGYSNAVGEPYVARPPGYPVVLALGLWLGQGSTVAVQVLQAGLGAAAVGLTYLACARLPLVDRAERQGLGLLAGLVLALDPVAIGQSPWILREAWLLFLVAALIAVLAAVGGRWRFVLAGGLLAVATLSHALYVLLGPFLALSELATCGPRRRWRTFLGWAGAGLIVAVAIGGWARRNEQVSGRFTLALTGNAAPARELWLTSECSNLWLSGDTATGFQALAWREEGRLVAELGLEGAKRELYARALANLRDHPGRTLARTLRQNVWYWLEIPGAVRLANSERLWPVRVLILPLHWARLVAAGAGLWWLLSRRQARPGAALLGGLLFFALAPAILYPVPRYLGPACPLLASLAALGLRADARRGPEAPA